MGRKKIYENPINKTIVAEQEDIDELEILEIKPQQVWEAGLMVVKPQGISAREYRIRELNKTKSHIRVKYEHEMKVLQDTLNGDIDMIEKELLALNAQEEAAQEGFEKLWNIFIKEHPQLVKQKPRWDHHDISIHPWWEEHGFPVTYGKLRQKFDEEGVQ